MREAQRLSLVAVGGVVGALLRYGVSEVVAPGSWPWATLMVNIGGALAIGVVVGVLVRNASASEVWGPLLITGVLGGFTTVSAFALDTFVLINTGAILMAVGYFTVTLAGGFLAVTVGHYLVGDRA